MSLLPPRGNASHLHDLANLILPIDTQSLTQPPKIQLPQVENKVHFWLISRVTVLHLGRSDSDTSEVKFLVK